MHAGTRTLAVGWIVLMTMGVTLDASAQGLREARAELQRAEREMRRYSARWRAGTGQAGTAAEADAHRGRVGHLVARTVEARTVWLRTVGAWARRAAERLSRARGRKRVRQAERARRVVAEAMVELLGDTVEDALQYATPGTRAAVATARDTARTLQRQMRPSRRSRQVRALRGVLIGVAIAAERAADLVQAQAATLVRAQVAELHIRALRGLRTSAPHATSLMRSSAVRRAAAPTQRHQGDVRLLLELGGLR